jgi:hypothetical protein
MRLARSSVIVALVAPAFACGCFALFSLDEYGPNRGTGDGGAIDDAATDTTTGDGGDAGSDAARGPRIVFVTNGRFNGSMGGPSGADNRCTAAANDAGLGGSYVAWLGSGANSPSTRIPDPQRAIVFPDRKTAVAGSMAELADSGPRAPLVVTESGASLTTADCADDRVWTNATAAGAVAMPSLDCGSWSGVTSGGNAGQLGGAHDEWTDGCPEQPCQIDAHLYCFQK